MAWGIRPAPKLGWDGIVGGDPTRYGATTGAKPGAKPDPAVAYADGTCDCGVTWLGCVTPATAYGDGDTTDPEEGYATYLRGFWFEICPELAVRGAVVRATLAGCRVFFGLGSRRATLPP
mmetsp:Transcript_7888/g.8690  ORF Transcript_7888/g.8690 Transcript_7888/m.8690 type:complete len:120 (-) Transcript_7888:164-523(-)